MERFLVDGMNVIGCRPDRWWRDLDGAVLRLIRSLDRWQAGAGVEVTAVFDGGAPSGFDGFDLGAVVVAFAGHGQSADDEIVRRIAVDSDSHSVQVVTSDRLLAERVRSAGAGQVVGAGGFRRIIDSGC